MGLGRYFRALSVPFVIGCVAFYSGAALSQASISYDPPTSAKVRKAIDAVTDQTEKQALADASGDVEPVFIILPGILGSKLFVTAGGQRKLIWGNITVANLFQPPDESIKYDEAVKAEAEPLDTFYIAGRAVDIYGKATAEIRRMNPGNASNILPFAYDWRQSNVKSAEDFANWICGKRADIQTHPVVFVAHSMGGLVLKYWLKHYYDSAHCSGSNDNFSSWITIRKIVFAGTPHFGAPKAILAFANRFTLYFDEDDSQLKALLARGDADILAKNLNTYGIYFPSAYELLPIVHSTRSCQEHFNWPRPQEPEQQQPLELHLAGGVQAAEIDLFKADFWHELGWPVQLNAAERETFQKQSLQKLLDSAKAFLCDIGDYQVDNKRFSVTFVAARNAETVCTIDITEPAPGEQLRSEVRKPMCLGDGTVPYWIAADDSRSDSDSRQADMSRHATLVSDAGFLAYLGDIYRQTLRDFAKTAVGVHQASPDAVATVLAKVGYVPASPVNEKDPDPTLADIQKRTLEKLGIKPQDILRPLTNTQNQATDQTTSRAAAYRLFADVASNDPTKRAWALNNAAEIYLRLDAYSQADSLARRALETAEAAGNAIPAKELRELRWKAALTVSLASDKLQHKNEALKFCKISINNGNGSGPYLASPGSAASSNKRPSDFPTCVLQKTALLAQ
jgi:hypothetical protein